MDKEYSVLYFSASKFFSSLAKHAFDKQDVDAQNMFELIYNCDCLIIDDLGTEYTNNFIASQFFTCINERLLNSRSTIISTNLSLDTLADLYTERSFSRITSNYIMLKLIGDDIPNQKKLKTGRKINVTSKRKKLRKYSSRSARTDSGSEDGEGLGDKAMISGKWRKESGSEHKGDVAFTGYDRDTFIIDADVPRFGSGEAKGIIKESVRGKDLYLMVDVCNYSLTYSLTGNTNHMSPDDHFQNLKRVNLCSRRKGAPHQCDHAIPLRKPSAQKNKPRVL
mgnify:CR=1 FL=1